MDILPYELPPDALALINRSGKVRDIVDCDIVDGVPAEAHIHSDRFSTADFVHQPPVPGKGVALTCMRVYQHGRFQESHRYSATIRDDVLVSGRDVLDVLRPELRRIPGIHRRTVIVRKLEVVNAEMVWRFVMPEESSLWAAYVAGEDPYELELPAGLQPMHEFWPPVFTPTTKFEKRDRPLSHKLVRKKHPEAVEVSYEAHMWLWDEFRSRYLVYIDGKCEVGFDPRTGHFFVIDEFGTLDCCRLVRRSLYRRDRSPPFIDKEEGRKIMVRLAGGKPTGPVRIPPAELEVIRKLYHDGTEIVVGKPFEDCLAMLDR